MPNTTEQYMNLKDKQYMTNTRLIPAKTEIMNLSKLEQNYNEKRDYMKYHSVGILKEKCKLFEGLRGTL